MKELFKIPNYTLAVFYEFSKQKKYDLSWYWYHFTKSRIINKTAKIINIIAQAFPN